RWPVCRGRTARGSGRTTRRCWARATFPEDRRRSPPCRPPTGPTFATAGAGGGLRRRRLSSRHPLACPAHLRPRQAHQSPQRGAATSRVHGADGGSAAAPMTVGSLASPVLVVPYHATTTWPARPAATVGYTAVGDAVPFTTTGAVQLCPPSLDDDR